MAIDRMLIVCSLIELSYLACSHGVTGFTCFQWIALTLLVAKLMALVIVKHRARFIRTAKFEVRPNVDDNDLDQD